MRVIIRLLGVNTLNYHRITPLMAFRKYNTPESLENNRGFIRGDRTADGCSVGWKLSQEYGAPLATDCGLR